MDNNKVIDCICAVCTPGDYPAVMKEYIGIKSADQGYNKSRLPEFSEEEIDRIKGNGDDKGWDQSWVSVGVWMNRKENSILCHA